MPAADMAADIVVVAVCSTSASAVFAAGRPGVPAAVAVAVMAVATVVSLIVLADISPAAAAKGIPRQAGWLPIRTFTLPGPGPSTGGRGWATGSPTRAAGPWGMIELSSRAWVCFAE